MLKQDSYLLLYIKEAIGFAQVRRICRLRAAGAKGIFSFAKENIPFGTPRERLRLAVSGLNDFYASGMGMPARGVAALELQDDLPLLLLSAAALPVSWQCSLIPVYLQSPQCGERSNAAFGTQSAAEVASLAPHDSKARLLSGHDSQGFMAKPCTPHLHCAARAVIQAPDCQCRGSRGTPPRPFSWGCKGDILFLRKRISPFALCRVPTRCGDRSSAAALHPPCALRAQKETALAGCFPPAPEARKLSKLSIWDTYPHFPSFFFG